MSYLAEAQPVTGWDVLMIAVLLAGLALLLWVMNRD